MTFDTFIHRKSGNQNGRPRKGPISEAYDNLLRARLPEKERKALGLKPGVTWAQAIAVALARHALTPSGVESAKELREAVEGRATQQVELPDGVDRKTEFIVTYGTAIPSAKTLPAIEMEKANDAKQLPAASPDESNGSYDA
jgi:hypothetical protein